jgi:Mg2+ and Co2+ transporter CorA
MDRQLKKELETFEDLIFDGKDINTDDFYLLKKKLLKKNELELLEIHLVLEAMLDKRSDQLMNRRLNLLTIWSTIFLPLSFYTGLWGMNFDDVPLISDDNGFWIFTALSVFTIGGMWWYFKKNKWI